MSNALATRQQGGGMLERFREAMPRYQATLPSHFTPAKMVELLNVLVYRTPDLQSCDPESVIMAAIQAGSLDLDLSPGMNEAFLVPKGGVALFWPGYKGFEKLAVRTGTVLYIQPREVCEGDALRIGHSEGNTHVFHEIDYQAKRGAITHVYAVAEMFNGKQMAEVMTWEEVEAIRKRSVMANAGPWKNDWKEMALKTVVKRICKRLPRSSDQSKAKAFDALNTAIEADNSQYEGLDALPAPEPPRNDSGFGRGQYASPEQTQTYLERLKKFLAAENAKWADRWGDKASIDELGTLREVLNVHQADGHLLKWSVDTGRLDSAIVPEEAKTRQLGRYTAIVYFRSIEDNKAFGEEMRRYAAEQWERKTTAVFKKLPHLIEPEDASQEEDPDIDLPYEPGSGG